MGQSIIELYKKFDKYKYVDEESIYYKILPSLRLNQYKSDNKTFFYNWAYLNDKAQKERGLIPGYVTEALKALRQYGTPSRVQDYIPGELEGVAVPF